MSSYIYKQTGINALVIEVSASTSVISNGLNSVKDAADMISNNSNWQGNQATSVKDYLSYVHGAIIASLILLTKDIYDQTMLYQNGYHSIDGNPYAVISETELTDIGKQLFRFAEAYDSMDQDARRIVNSVSHIGYIDYPGLNNLPFDLAALKDKLYTLRDDIGDHEADFQARFEAERALIGSVKAMMSEARSTNLAAFSASNLANSSAYQKLASDYQALAQIVAGNAEGVKQAETAFAETYKVLQEDYEKRLEEARQAKFWTGLATAAASAIIITATGGAGVVLVGAVCGAVNAAVGSYYDQRVGTVACPGSVNGWKVVGAAAFGFAVGAATSYVGAQFGQMAGGLQSEGLKLAAEKAGIETLKSVSQGAISRAGDACFDSMVAGKSPLDVAGDTLSAAFDPRKALGDAVGGFTGSLFTQGFDKASGALGDKLFGNTSDAKPYANTIQVNKTKSPLLHQGYDIASSTIKESGKGIVKRGTSTFAQTGDLRKSWESATDTVAMLNDAASTLVTETANTVTADANAHMISRISKAQKKIDEVQEQIEEKTVEFNKRNEEVCEERGIKRTRNGTPDYSGTDDCAAEVEVEQTVVQGKDADHPNAPADYEKAGRNQDYQNAYQKMVAEGLIDGNEYIQKDSGHVVRREVVEVDGKTTVVETEYTIHHVEYDINTGKTRFQLVKTDAHSGIKHRGGNAEANDAYHKYNVGETIQEYNEAVKEANDARKGRVDPNTGKNDNSIANGYKNAKKGSESGVKVTSNVEEKDEWSEGTAGLTDYVFLTP